MYNVDSFLFKIFYKFGSMIGADWFFVFFAKYFPYIIFISFICLILKEKDINKKIYLFILSFLVEVLNRGIITEAIRFFYNRPRPFVALGVDSLFSYQATPAFPSGHTVFLVSLALIVFLISKKWGWIFFSSAVVVGIARVICGVHYPFDIVGGIIVSIIGFFIIYLWVFPKRKFVKTSD
jgi:undecaprenyl-diphosphatase